MINLQFAKRCLKGYTGANSAGMPLNACKVLKLLDPSESGVNFRAIFNIVI